MKPSARAAAVAAFFALLVLGLLTGDDARVVTQTSFGQVPFAHGALFDLLHELDLPVARSFVAPDALPPGATIWWIEPDGVTGPPPDVEARPRAEPPSPLRGDALAGFIERGGTAVVLLPAGAGCDVPSVESLAGVALPARRAIQAEACAEKEPKPATLAVSSGAASPTRAIELVAPRVFDAAADELAGFRFVASIDEQPFVLERAIGAGRLVIGADARFVTNEWLDHADAALLAFDLVRAYGTPRIDEHEHGMTTQRGATAYLVRSPALPFFAGLALLAIAIAWSGAALPKRAIADDDPRAPTLESFVASMANLYAATGDYARVLDRARELAARRLRRHFGLPPDAPVAELLGRLARRRRLPADGLGVLSHGARVRDAAELDRAVAALDALVEEAVS
jgi:hypothetical protein